MKKRFKNWLIHLLHVVYRFFKKKADKNMEKIVRKAKEKIEQIKNSGDAKYGWVAYSYANKQRAVLDSRGRSTGVFEAAYNNNLRRRKMCLYYKWEKI